MTEALVNPELLVWARERAQLDDGAMAHALKVPVEKVVAWEKGETRPSFGQAERWAQVTHTPFGLLFVSTPPEETPPPPDFRRVDGETNRAPSPEFRDLYDDVLFKHAWFRDFREDLGFPVVSFVGSVQSSIAPVAFAARMRKDLGIDAAFGRDAKSVDDRFRSFVATVEARGVWVLRSGCVAGNTHRVVPVEEFRGFAIADSLAPLVFINARDAVTAQLFTLVHELAHLWLGASGVSDPFAHASNATERLCNATAAELLVPAAELSERWQRKMDLAEQSVSLAREFKVSAAVVAIRARALGLATQRELDVFLEVQRAGWKKKSKGGGNFYTTAMTRNGRPFVRAVVSAAASRDISLRDGGELLNMSAAKVMAVARREGLVR